MYYSGPYHGVIHVIKKCHFSVFLSPRVSIFQFSCVVSLPSSLQFILLWPAGFVLTLAMPVHLSFFVSSFYELSPSVSSWFDGLSLHVHTHTHVCSSMQLSGGEHQQRGAQPPHCHQLHDSAPRLLDQIRPDWSGGGNSCCIENPATDLLTLSVHAREGYSSYFVCHLA